MSSYAWSNAGLLCGQCHCLMDCSVSKNDIPVEFRARCGNPHCVNFGKIFRVGNESAVKLVDITDSVAREELV